MFSADVGDLILATIFILALPSLWSISKSLRRIARYVKYLTEPHVQVVNFQPKRMK
jgi:hypothetical protein